MKLSPKCGMSTVTLRWECQKWSGSSTEPCDHVHKLIGKAHKRWTKKAKHPVHVLDFDITKDQVAESMNELLDDSNVKTPDCDEPDCRFIKPHAKHALLIDAPR